LLININVTTTA